MKVMKQHLVPLSMVIGMLGLVAACSSQAPASLAPSSTGNSAPATQAAAATAATAAASLAGAQVPVRVASATTVVPTRAGQGQAPSSVKRIDACALVTQDEAAAASGLAMPRKHASTDAKSPSCEYGEEDPNGITVTVAVVQVGAKGSFDDTAKTIAASREDIPGVGDAAYIITGLRMIYVLKGDILLRIQLANPFLADDVYRARLTAMARTAVSRL